MGIIYRSQKKEPLTIEEMDGNFANLEERVKDLEMKPQVSEGIGKIIQEGDQLTIVGTFGSVLGKVILPKAIPSPKGQWQSNSIYRLLDWVQVKQSVYTCVKPHTSTDFEVDYENWALVFEV